MFKSIFGKQFAAFFGTLIFSFTLLAIGFLIVFQNFFIDRKKIEIERQCALYENAILRNYTAIFSNYELLRRDLTTVYEYTGVSFFFAQLNGESDDKHVWGRVLLTTDLDRDRVIAALTSDSFEGFFSDERDVSIQGNFFGIYNENVLSVSHPVSVRGNVVGAIFISMPLADVNGQMAAFIKLALGCLLVCAVIAFILNYILSKRISGPIRKVSEAAKIIADGDFEKRLTAKSRDEIGELAKSFNNMAESLNNQEIQRREFIANISHDLRSPLTSIKGFLTAVIDGTIPAEQREKYLNIILNETERMTKLANDVLTLNKPQNPAADLDITKFDINGLLLETALSLEPRIAQKHINVDFALPDEKLTIQADREKIKRVIYNLVDNAVKFSKDGGNLTLSARAEDHTALISVKDDGIGISEQDQKRVFERFYKADASRGADKTGSGLGLAIVREFVKAHGGTVAVHSDPGCGCEFVVSIPND